jgi:hypothetical protein
MRVIDGRLIRADEAKIIFAADDHQECTLEVAANATVTRDGQEALLKNLRMGDELQVTTQTHRGKPMAVVVAARTAY